MLCLAISPIRKEDLLIIAILIQSFAIIFVYEGLQQQGGKGYVDIGRLRNAQFLHKELPIRIAQRAIDLLTLPHGLNCTREVQSIANTYLQ